MRAIAIHYTPHVTRTIAVLVLLITVSMIAYGFFLLEAVAHTASLSDATRSVHIYMKKVGMLEQQYLAQTNNITKVRAQALGFVDPAKGDVATVFADNAPTPLLSVR